MAGRGERSTARPKTRNRPKSLTAVAGVVSSLLVEKYLASWRSKKVTIRKRNVLDDDEFVTIKSIVQGLGVELELMKDWKFDCRRKLSWPDPEPFGEELVRG
jgi:hypothetical protein